VDSVPPLRWVGPDRPAADRRPRGSPGCCAGGRPTCTWPRACPRAADRPPPGGG